MDLNSASMRYSGRPREYLPLMTQEISDGVAKEPGMGGLGCGALTITDFLSSPLAFAPQQSAHL